MNLKIAGVAVATLAASLTPASTGGDVARAAHVLVADGARSATVAVWDHDRLTATAAPDTSEPATRLFRIGSVTKVFTATVALQLVGERRLGLDDPVGRYLHDIPPVYREVTVRQLLQHRSGMPNYTAPAYADWLRQAQQSDTVGPRDVLRFALSHPPLFAPGAQWSYANTNYIALGLLVEAITRHPFARELAQRITGRLGLVSTGLARTRTVPGSVDDPGINPGVPWTAGGIISTAGELTRFLSALLSGRLLRPSELALMRQTVSTPDGLGYGLGLESTLFPCGTFWGHIGSTLDYVTRAWSSPDGRRVVVLFWRGALTGSQPVPLLECPGRTPAP